MDSVKKVGKLSNVEFYFDIAITGPFLLKPLFFDFGLESLLRIVNQE